MKLNVNTMRILLMALNIGVTAFIVTGYVEGMGQGGILSIFSGDADGDSRPESADLDIKKGRYFEYKDDIVQPESAAKRLQASATWLMPQPPADPVSVSEELVEPTEEEEEEPIPENGEPIEGGPLQKDNWFYVHGIIFSETPLKSWIRLEKKDAEKKASIPSPSRYSRSRSSGSRSSSSSIRRSSSSSKLNSARSANSITLTLEDRWFVDEEKGLDFKVHHVDAEKFVYWTDNPNRKYSLSRVSESYFLEETREERRLAPKKEEEEGEGKEEEEEKKFFKRYAPGINPRDKRQEDYQNLLDGKETAGFLEPKQLGDDPASKGGLKLKGSGSTAFKPSSSKSSAYKKPVYSNSGSTKSKSSASKPRKTLSAAEQKAQLGKTMQGLKNNPKYQQADPKQRAALERLIKGKPGGGK
jgi:hypothetical protein